MTTAALVQVDDTRDHQSPGPAPVEMGPILSTEAGASDEHYVVRVTATTYDGEEVRVCKHSIADGTLKSAVDSALTQRLHDNALDNVRRRLEPRLERGPAVYEHWFDAVHQLEIAVVPAHLLGEQFEAAVHWL
jgi:hypothetical protein